VRLRAHLGHLGMLLEGKGKDSPGRRMDFLAQEIGRELNTLGGKIQDAEISALVIDGKAEYYEQRADWRLGGEGSPGLETFKAQIYQVGVTRKF